MSLNNYTGNTNNNNPGNPGGPGIPGLPPGSTILPNLPGMGGDDIDPTEILINYNERFKTAGTILFRDNVIYQILSTLIGMNKPNALLVGPAGVGKTKIVEDIAYRLANDDDTIPKQLRGFTIYELPLSNVVAGSSMVGDLEKKAKAVVNFVEDTKEKAILFIDEIHQLVNTSTPTYQKIAQILKPALARGVMHVIGATTTQEAKDLADDPAFKRRFTQIIVDELTQKQTLEIMKVSKGKYFQHYQSQVTIDDSTLETIVQLADQYRPAGSHRPDNAITLLDRACGDAVINRQVQINTAKKQNNQIALQAFTSMPTFPLTTKQIRNTAIRIATGNAKPESLNINELNASLTKIKGQDAILQKIIRILRENELDLFRNITETKKPTTLLFVGPSGVGKTEITKIIAKHLTGTSPIILNMTEYNTSASISRIIGSSAGYVGYDSHNELPFDCLLSNPYQIILLDEFEKGDRAVQRLFMQAFDQGYITTARGTVIDFSKCIIVATTNAGQTTGINTCGFMTNADDVEKEIDIQVLSRYFDIELINRFKHRIQFNYISKETYAEILQEQYTKAVASIAVSHPKLNLHPTIPNDDLENLVKTTYRREFGARPAEETIQKYTLDQVL